MYINLSDPEPHRCPNFRMVTDSSGTPRQERCKKPSMPPHFCEFDGAWQVVDRKPLYSKPSWQPQVPGTVKQQEEPGFRTGRPIF